MQVVLKIIKHCQQALPGFVNGQLLGLDIGRTLEVTNCFPFPGKDSGETEDDSAEYQMEMMRCLREVNVDNNTVGWYQSTYFSSFIDEACVETQFNYQVALARSLTCRAADHSCQRPCCLPARCLAACCLPPLRVLSSCCCCCLPTTWLLLSRCSMLLRLRQSNIKNCVLIIYDPSRARTSGLALRAFRLTDTFMSLYSDGKVTYDALASANQTASADVFQELPIKVRNSHLNSALLLELQDECGINSHASDFSRLELNTNPFLEKQLQLLIECIEDLQAESNKLQHYERAVQRQKSSQSQYLAKKRAEAVARRARGEEPLPEEDLSNNSLFKPIPKPSRLESLLITNQMQAYCQQVNQFSGQSFAKLFLMQSLNAGGQ